MLLKKKIQKMIPQKILHNLLLVMIVKHIKNMDMMKLSVGFHSIFMKTRKIIIKNYYFCEPSFSQIRN
jgi:hypothetical protein